MKKAVKFKCVCSLKPKVRFLSNSKYFFGNNCSMSKINIYTLIHILHAYMFYVRERLCWDEAEAGVMTSLMSFI